ncbi:D-2-hydroxyacid dehydrogenase [Ornithinimicrobium cavernae]|uniref:D-2-hydroxyacid dehydrogenase n=1 Tax=Ornithinimicrobium cavernae TaxID=2666047 RepID=UPI000D693733|nr:D-2-hydroxyacid dehydrogenase [Ornithinimicrobium cavernae]
MNVLLSLCALERHRDLLEQVRPEGARWFALGTDGELRVEGGTVHWDPETLPLEVAWRTTDLLRGGPLRAFYRLVTESSSLRWLQSNSAGFDSPVLSDLVRRGVRVTTSHIAGPPIAEFVLRAAMDHLQGADVWRESATQRQWQPHDFVEMGSTRWLVIGLGQVGAAVAQRARAFGAHVTGVRRSQSATSVVDSLATPQQLRDLLPSCDVVVIAAPANSATAGLVDSDFLRRMKTSSVLINVGRGALVDERALLASLDAGRPGRAVLDVAASEPLPSDDPLWSHPQVVITPHNASLGDGRFERAAAVFASNLQHYAHGEPLAHEIRSTDLQT